MVIYIQIIHIHAIRYKLLTFHMQGLSFGEDVGVDDFQELLVRSWHVGAGFTMQPLFARDALVSFPIHRLFTRAETNGLVRVARHRLEWATIMISLILLCHDDI